MASVSPDSASAKRSKRRPPRPTTAKDVKPRRRWPRRLAIALAGYALLMWALPILLAWTPLRDRALAMALPGLNGTISSGGASLGWFSPVVFTNVEIRDSAGKVLVSAAKVSTDKSLLRLALSQTDLGTIRIEQPNLALEMRNDGSNAEDVLVPFIKSGNGGGPLTVNLEFVDGAIDMHDVATERHWKIDAFQTSLRLEPKNPVPLDCSVSGTVELDKPSHFALGYKQGGQESASRSPLAPGDIATEVGNAPIDVQAQIDPLPLEIFRPVAARLLPDAQVSGLLSANLKYQTVAAQPAPKSLLQGSLDLRGLDLSAASLRRDHLKLAVLQVPCQITWQGKQIDIEQLGIQCDVGQVSLSGQTTLPDKIAARSLADWLRETFSLDADLDLAKLARLLPDTLHVREQVSVTSGNIHLNLASGTASGAHRWTGQFKASNITATNAGKPVAWNQPISVNFAAHDTPTGPVVENLDCQSSFVHASASGTPDRFTAKADCDLNQLASELGQFVDLGGVKPAGGGQATLDWQRTADGSFQAIGTCSLNDLQLAIAGRTWNEPLLAATLNANGQLEKSGGARIETASLDVNDNSLVGVSPPSGGVPRANSNEGLQRRPSHHATYRARRQCHVAGDARTVSFRRDAARRISALAGSAVSLGFARRLGSRRRMQSFGPNRIDRQRRRPAASSRDRQSVPLLGRRTLRRRSGPADRRRGELGFAQPDVEDRSDKRRRKRRRAEGERRDLAAGGSRAAESCRRPSLASRHGSSHGLASRSANATDVERQRPVFGTSERHGSRIDDDVATHRSHRESDRRRSPAASRQRDAPWSDFKCSSGSLARAEAHNLGRWQV